MRDRLEEFGPDAQVALITFTSGPELAAYTETHDLPFPVLADQPRDTYRAYGLGRGSWGRVWGWRAARRYIELIRKNGRAGLQRPTEDSLQLGGDFVIAPDGALAWGFWSDGPDDRPSVDELIEAVAATRRPSR